MIQSVYGKKAAKNVSLANNILFMVALCNRETIYIFMLWFVMVALCNRADHYIFAL